MVWRQTKQVIPLSTGGSDSIKDGLAITHWTRITGADTFPSLPADVKSLMQDAEKSDRELNTTGKIGSFLGSWFRKRPLVILKLLAIKAARSWYALLSHRFEMYLAVLQSLYLPWAIRGLGLAWPRGGRARISRR